MLIKDAIACRYCGHFHGDLCPKVKAFEYEYPEGARGEALVTRVEFFAPNEHVHPELLEAARKIAEARS